MQDREVSEVGRQSCEQSPLFMLQGLVPASTERKKGKGWCGARCSGQC